MGIFSDIGSFLLHKPSIPTLIGFPSEREREDYSHRIMQRLGVNVSKYEVLNIHRIGIEAPVSYVFDEILNWREGLPCWPSSIAGFQRAGEGMEHIEVLLLGGMRRFHAFMRGLFGSGFGRLFRLTAVRSQGFPGSSDLDNARYLVFECSGGYPIGICTIYARSRIREKDEAEQTQLFAAVGFDFYGRKGRSRLGVVRRVWEGIHNRVVGNVLNRFKEACEARCQERVAHLLRHESGAR